MCSATPDPVVIRNVIDSLFTDMQQAFSDTAEVFLAAGTPVTRLQQLYQSYTEAVLSRKKLFFMGYNNICCFQEEDNEIGISFQPDNILLQKFETALRNDHCKEAGALITKLFYNMRNPLHKYESNSIKNVYYSLLITMDSVCRKRNIASVFPHGSDFIWETIAQVDTIFALQDYITLKLSLFSQAIAGKSDTSLLVHRILQYIEQHYGKSNLSINKIAENLHFTPAYLCQVFKNEFGVTINTYIGNFRIRKAIELLKEKDTKLYEVSFRVGYSDQNYFTRQFKKQVGMPPFRIQGEIFLMKNYIKRIFYRTNLMKKLMISYSILIVLPLLALTLFSYAHLSKVLIQQFEYSSDRSLQQTSIYLDKVLDEIVAATDLIAFNSTLSDIFQEDVSSKSIIDMYRDYLTASSVIKEILVPETIHSVDVYVEENPFYVLKQAPNNEGISFISLKNSFAGELDQMLTNYYGKVLWFTRSVQNSITQKDSMVITGTRYLKNTTDYTTNIGILAVNIQQSSLNSIIGRTSILPNSLTLLVDESGATIAISGTDLLQQYSLTTELIMENLAAGKSSFQTGRDTLLVNSISLTAADWTLISIIPYDEMLQSSTDTLNSLLLFMLIVSLLFYLAAYFISRLISRRLKDLSTRMKEVQFDNYFPIPAEDGTDEIIDLINIYNHMMNKINEYAESQYQLGIALKTSELNALQAQINPHFLYNTLDLLHCIAWEHGIQEMSEISSLLTRFYRLSLNKGREMVFVKSALELIEVYVKLQNFRFESSIRLVVQVDAKILDYKILKLLLQPIVENSIIHGILEKDIQSGTVTISGEVIGNVLQFTIIDDGIGMTEEELTRLVNAPEEAVTDSNTSMGYGVKNVIERIHLYYGIG